MPKKTKRSQWLRQNKAQVSGTAFSARPEQDRKPLIGREARTVTSLHPTGEIRIDGRLIDAVAEGTFVEAGEKVRVTGTRDFRLIVERVT